ncbi:NADP-dependent oxidoreductase [Kribbella sp. NBC_01245]|uniref:NADP-dependent oxidoreductase n=1 Tax=Kribbella sp. NBC_01245 TaxID=2903578 RepID=UPI002E2B0981|nr:NADP-dependent oxidoreductase [Kribbella sp. NBC_01245]
MTEIHLVGRPTGMPTADLFAFVEHEPLELRLGTALVENVLLSVDPYMRECMDEEWDLHSPLEGRALGRVVESRTPDYSVGDIVFHRKSWRTHAVVSAAESRRIEDLPDVPLSAHLGILGGTGLSAYVGLVRVAKLQPGETVFISAAAGGVGTAAGRLARLLGAGRVIGSTGTAAKANHLVSNVGFDAAFSYRDGPITESLAKAAPDGIDVYLDNVGGDHLAAAIDVLKPRGRIAWCGAVSTYNHEASAAPHNLYDIVEKQLRLEGFLVSSHRDARPELLELLVPHLQAGRVVSDETVVSGFDSMVEAFLAMLRGENTGKMLVRVV